MARIELTERGIKALGVGAHADGGNLYLQVTEGASGLCLSWLFRYATGRRVVSASGKERQEERWEGLGSYPDVTLAEARDLAYARRKQRARGVDPIEHKRAAKAAARVAQAKTKTFGQCVDLYLKAHRAGWRNEKHAAQWEATLTTYAGPVLGPLPVGAIDTGLVTDVLEPIWSAKPETASRLRGRIEAILDWAKVKGYRDGENPARWRGHLDKLLPARSKVQKVEHHAALPYAALPAFMVQLRNQEGSAARALEFAILTAARTGEVLGATWDEVDLAEKIWIVPAERMKGGREHPVPLSARAVELLQTQATRRQNEHLFPGQRGPLSNMAFLMLLRRMRRGDLTAHGFRSTFRDWAGDRTHTQREVIEAALAHVAGGKVEVAYRRSDALEKRRELMEAWADYCISPPIAGKVLSFTSSR